MKMFHFENPKVIILDPLWPLLMMLLIMLMSFYEHENVSFGKPKGNYFGPFMTPSYDAFNYVDEFLWTWKCIICIKYCEFDFTTKKISFRK